MRRVAGPVINHAETIIVPPSGHALSQDESGCIRAVIRRMSIFANAELANAASKRCPNCHHFEATIADLQAWVEDLRQSRDHWRDLALDARDPTLEAKRAADVASTLSKEIRSHP
jgi:hypothetical protein